VGQATLPHSIIIIIQELRTGNFVRKHAFVTSSLAMNEVESGDE